MNLTEFAMNWTEHGVKELTDEILLKADLISKEIISDDTRSFENTFAKFHGVEALVSEWSCKVVLATMVHTVPEIRDTCNVLKNRLKNWFDDRYTNLDLFQSLNEAYLKVKNDLDPLDKRLADKVIREFKSRGVNLDCESLERLKMIKMKIGQNETEFQRALGEDQSYNLYQHSDLEGCPEDFIKSLEKVDGLFKVTAKPSHVRIISELCSVEKTREKHLKLSQSKCKENAKILCELIKLRSEAAHLLKYNNWNDYKLLNTMASKESNVWKLLKELSCSLDEKLSNELNHLTQLKVKETGSDSLQLWDIGYYEKKYLKENNNIDETKIREYLPLDFCFRKVIQIYEYLFGINFTLIENHDFIWHPDVKLFSVVDSSSRELLGYFYLDLFSRSGKYSHQCVIPLSPCYDLESSYRVPVVANLSNLSSKSLPGRPSALLSHGELITFFHEFGHAVHAVVTHSKYSTFSWSWNAVPYPAGVEIDFLEVPSKGFENWAWQNEILSRVTFEASKLPDAWEFINHGAQIPEISEYPMPDSLISSLKKTRFIFAGYDYNRMVFMSAFDLIVHGISYNGTYTVNDDNAKILLPEDLTFKYEDLTPTLLLDIWSKVQKKIVHMTIVEGTNPLANWYHMAMGYDSGYYGYLWSEGVGADIYQSYFSSNCLSKESGKVLRDQLLSLGSKEDANQMVFKLLGRQPNVRALIDRIME